MHPPIIPTQMTDTKKALPRTFFQCLINRPEHMTALSNWEPYALRRSVNKFSSSALGKINKFLLLSLMRQFADSSSVKFLFLLCARQNKQVSFALAYASVPAHTQITIPKVSTIPMVGDPKRQGRATQLRYRSGYRWCTF